MTHADPQRPPRVLVIEDEAKTASTVALYLRHGGMEVTVARDGASGLELARSAAHDLVILDLMLPGVDGREICRVLRAESRVPIIMLTARTTEQDRIDGLELGADDYVAKPFSPRELVARVRANLRRSGMERGAAGPPLHRGALRIDPGAREVTRGGTRVELTRHEFDILLALAARPGQVWSRERLNEHVSAGPATRGERTIDAHIKNLRRKLEPDRRRPRYIRTVFGVGYKFHVPDGADGESS